MLRLSPALLFLLCFSAAAATPPRPILMPLETSDLGTGCGCRFGTSTGQTLLYWSWEQDRQFAYIRTPEGLQRLTLRSQRLFPGPRARDRRGERMTQQFTTANWSIQSVSELTEPCAPRARSCRDERYRSLLILQWNGTQRDDRAGWGQCGCN